MELITKNLQQTMTSLELVEFINMDRKEQFQLGISPKFEQLRHDNFMSKVLDVLGGKGSLEFKDTYVHPQNGQEYPMYRFPKREACLMAMSYSYELQAKVFDRMTELEAKPAFQVPTTLSGALRLAAEQAEVIEQQAAQLAYAAPKVAFVEQYVDSTSGSKGFRQVCKLLGAKEPEFRAFLHDEKIMYKLGGEWVPFAQHLDAGRFEVKAGTSETSGHAYNSAKFTAKGVEWVAGEWAKHKIKEVV